MHTNAAENTRSAAPNAIETNKITHVETYTQTLQKKKTRSAAPNIIKTNKITHKKKHAHKHCKKTNYMIVQ
jgi:hypothetical protein